MNFQLLLFLKIPIACAEAMVDRLVFDNFREVLLLGFPKESRFGQGLSQTLEI
jgi:hypothetical protein